MLNALIPLEILPLRHGLWTHVASRKHFPERIFFGGARELMLYGTVKYVLKADPSNEVEVPWAGRAVFDTGDETNGLKMKFYQVYLVCPFPCFWVVPFGLVANCVR